MYLCNKREIDLCLWGYMAVSYKNWIQLMIWCKCWIQSKWLLLCCCPHPCWTASLSKPSHQMPTSPASVVWELARELTECFSYSTGAKDPGIVVCGMKLWSENGKGENVGETYQHFRKLLPWRGALWTNIVWEGRSVKIKCNGKIVSGQETLVQDFSDVLVVQKPGAVLSLFRMTSVSSV